MPAVSPTSNAADTRVHPCDQVLERVIDGLLDGLQWQASVFHVGQYCGRWRASTQGRSQASFHLVLGGRCWLHRPGLPSLALGARDAVFLMQDVPHFLSPYENPAIPCTPQAMQPLQPEGGLGTTGLACGFFSFEGPLRGLLAGAFADVLVLRAQHTASREPALLFELMVRESLRSPEQGSVALDRLSGLLFFYAWRELAQREPEVSGVLALLRQPGFSELVQALLEEPQRPWTVDDMARRVHLSRAALFRHFQAACGQSPLQFVQLLRMQTASRLLARGQTIARVASAVGYESVPAFSRAFKRVLGQQPGAWQRGEVNAMPAPGEGLAANGYQSEIFGH
ncbi:cupin domain-containing protein [Roseateles sp.]|uniref:AraC family transcriptional regulator n=1 Tax=Roseateles sp. TaxID=1971397 RepID=UPI0039E7E1B2